MNTYSVQMVGGASAGLFETHSKAYAVAEAAGCDITAVCLPIWRQEPDRLRLNYAVECFMPLDNSGRQWIVREA